MKHDYIEFAFDEKLGYARCLMIYNGQAFEGGAKCHPDDMDMISERTGCCIAEARAYIKALRFKRNHEIQPKLDVLRHVYNNMQTSKYFNSKSYEAKMLRSQIGVIEKELAAVNEDLAEEKKYLKEYIDKKDKFYQRLRARNQ